MSQRYEVLVGLNYPTDPQVEADLQELGRQAMEARALAVETHDPRDIDAAKTAENAARDAAMQALDSGLMKRVEAGEDADDLPESSIPWLLEQGLIRVPVVAPAVSEPQTPAEVEAFAQDIGRPEDSAVDRQHADEHGD